MDQKNIFCAWNGGHDCGLSLYHAKKSNQVKCLVTPLVEMGSAYRTNICSPSLLRAQADLLKIPLLIFNTSSEELEENYKQTMANFKKYKIEGGVFPFINNETQKNSIENICHSQGIEAHMPLWERNKEGLLSEFLELGFKAKIISVNEKYLTRDFLSKDLDKDIIEEFRNRKIDLFGENGEFQTILYEAPYFSQRLQLKDGDINLKNGYWTLDITNQN
ncbi:hypothetical protein AXG55_07755 [Silvanigrella aquatica]|uniref:Diphthamide synthase domain-containing protein n=1 Tax=Silvanigrella aquatica TaxID=1915309 RepID=A0A1L4D0S5_9BACT|nr:hypothetical protein AXG55_07755 [Silvanigrella aquatica]